MNRTRKEFVDRWKHDLAGMVLDAATNKVSGATLALLLGVLVEKCELRLGQYWDDLSPVKTEANGKQQAPQGATQRKV